MREKERKSYIHTVFICEAEPEERWAPGRKPEVWPRPTLHLFLAARGFRLIFFDLSLFFFGGSGFACMCLPYRLKERERKQTMNLLLLSQGNVLVEL